MSRPETPLTEFGTEPAPEPNEAATHPQQTRTAASWTPEDRPTCQNCGGHVSRQYRRALGDDSDVAHACPECTSKEDIYRGAASNPDYADEEHFAAVGIPGGGR